MKSKKTFLFILSTIIILWPFKSISAYDKEVVCGSSECTGFSGALFSENDIKPGDSINKSLSITNNKNENLSVTLSSEKLSGTDDILAERITVIIYDGGVILFSGNFLEFLGKSINLGSISQNQIKVFEIHTDFPIDSGNVYQDKRVNFSMTLNVTGEESGTSQTLSSTSTSSDTSATNDSSGSVLGDSLIGQVLGLSDTGGLVINLFYLTSGLFLATLGIRIIKKYNKN
jgi:hypothetical protein